MKAAYIMRHGGPEVFQYGDLPDPVAGGNDVLVYIHAASVNGADWRVRQGTYAPVAQFPYVPGRDFSGIVAAVGTDVNDFMPGDPVFGVCDVGQEGAYAEKVAIKAALIARKPASLTHPECAALALAGLTALVSIEDTLQLRSGETILIHGGAGGVASIAIQLARRIGAKVIATARIENHAYVRALGADVVIDYRTQDFTRGAANCDAVFDTVGGEVAIRSFTAPARDNPPPAVTGSVGTRRERESPPAWQACLEGPLSRCPLSLQWLLDAFLTLPPWRDYSNYVKTKLVRIGNSRGVRIPQGILRVYGLREGSELEIEERREGLLLRVAGTAPEPRSWAEAYREMAAESSEASEWADWDAAAGDGDAG